jgi:hypothetical protein
MATYYVSSLAAGGGSGTSGSPYTLAEAVSNAAAGDTVRIKNDGTYSVGSILSFAAGSAASGRVTIMADTTNPTLDLTANIRCFDLKTYQTYIGINVTVSSGTKTTTSFGRPVSTNARNVQIVGCSVDGTQWGIEDFWALSAVIKDTEIKNTVSHGITVNQSDGGLLTVYGCKIHGCGGHGIQMASSTVSILFATRNLIYGNTSDGINLPQVTLQQYIIYGNTIDGNGSDGIEFAGSLSENVHMYDVFSNIITNNGAYGIRGLSNQDRVVAPDYNFYYNNTSAALLNITAGAHDVTLSGDPYTNKAGGDFSLNNTASAGAAVRAASLPGAFRGGSTTGYLDGGAVQHQDSGGTSGPTFSVG